MEEALRDLIQGATTPDATEVRRALCAIGVAVEGGGVVHTADLLHALAKAEGLDDPDPNAQRQLEVPDDVSALPSIINRDHPMMKWIRLEAAGFEALAEMVARGLLVPMADPFNPRDNSPRLRYRTTSGSGSSVHWQQPLPQPLSKAYRVPYRHLGHPVGPFHPDVFLGDLDALGLDARTRHCLAEALEAYRRGLYIAASSLLGATVEGAWYAAGEKLRMLDSELERALDNQGTARLQSRVAHLIRTHVKPSTLADELLGHAGLVRDLRNYGVHPRDVEDASIDALFGEEATGLLVLNTHRHLVTLARVARDLGPSWTSASNGGE